MLELIQQYQNVALAVTAIVGAIFAIYKLYSKLLKGKILRPITSRFEKIDRVFEAIGPNGGSSLYDKVVAIDRKISMTDARTQALHSALGLAEWHSDVNGLATGINDVATKLTGRPESEFLGNNWINVVHPDDRDAVVEEWGEAVKDRRPFVMKYRWVTIHDEPVYIRVIAKPVFNSQKLFIGYIGTVVQIKKEEWALTHSA